MDPFTLLYYIRQDVKKLLLVCVRDRNSVFYSGPDVFKSGLLQGFLTEGFCELYQYVEAEARIFLKIQDHNLFLPQSY